MILNRVRKRSPEEGLIESILLPHMDMQLTLR